MDCHIFDLVNIYCLLRRINQIRLFHIFIINLQGRNIYILDCQILNKIIQDFFSKAVIIAMNKEYGCLFYD